LLIHVAIDVNRDQARFINGYWNLFATVHQHSTRVLVRMYYRRSENLPVLLLDLNFNRTSELSYFKVDIRIAPPAQFLEVLLELVMF